METAISKSMKNELQELFGRFSRSFGNRAKIHVNSVITEDQ